MSAVDISALMVAWKQDFLLAWSAPDYAQAERFPLQP